MDELSINHFFSIDLFAHKGLFEEALFPWEALQRLESYLRSLPLGRIECAIPSSAILENPSLISIGEGSVVEPGAYIKGPCVLGARTQVRSHAYIRGNVLSGDDCVIGHATEVKHAIFLNDVHAAHFNYVGDSILGNHVNLGAGVKCANVRLDNQTISIRIEEMLIDTQLKKLGAIIGDASQIGCNSVTSPGTLIGKGSLCHPSLHIAGLIPPYSKVKNLQKNHVEVLQ